MRHVSSSFFSVTETLEEAMSVNGQFSQRHSISERKRLFEYLLVQLLPHWQRGIAYGGINLQNIAIIERSGVMPQLCVRPIGSAIDDFYRRKADASFGGVHVFQDLFSLSIVMARMFPEYFSCVRSDSGHAVVRETRKDPDLQQIFKLLRGDRCSDLDARIEQGRIAIESLQALLQPAILFSGAGDTAMRARSASDLSWSSSAALLIDSESEMAVLGIETNDDASDVSSVSTHRSATP